ncbi:calcium-binding protein KRP1-like [Neltuma alba]|uniref:calcium-binding protein KRP1-like n=1 Tax=Neltuma alba TaxID=207710 RepID=UPI0010A51FC1|nr:calcium-binding protein KRP1-like [Prosopis alba]
MAALQFQDLLPVIAHKLGGQGLLTELCNGFQLLMDKHKGLITLDSLRINSALLGLQDLTQDDLFCMISEADLDGDGALSLLEFCVLMFRLSPDLMQHSSFWLHHPPQRHLPNSSS